MKSMFLELGINKIFGCVARCNSIEGNELADEAAKQSAKNG